MLDKIMIATDGSDTSRHAAHLAISLAKHSAGKVIAVYVMDMQRLAHLPGLYNIAWLEKELA